MDVAWVASCGVLMIGDKEICVLFTATGTVVLFAFAFVSLREA